MLQLRLYIVKSTCRPLAIKTNPLKTCLQKQKYNATIGDSTTKAFTVQTLLEANLLLCFIR